jgi:hypothetical protein
MAAPNIVNVSTIIGKTSVQIVGTSPTAIVSNSGDSNKVFKINGLVISNVDGNDPKEVTVDLFRGSTSYKIISTVTIPSDASLVVISKSTSIYLEEGDSIRCVADEADKLHAICSYEEIS